jgi:hypothetical protein
MQVFSPGLVLALKVGVLWLLLLLLLLLRPSLTDYLIS